MGPIVITGFVVDQYLLDASFDCAYRSFMSTLRRRFFMASPRGSRAEWMVRSLGLLLAAAISGCGPKEDTASNAPGPPANSVSNPSASTANAKPASQPELATKFDASTVTIFEARTADALANLKVLQQATLSKGANGLIVTASASDPSLSLPPFIADKQAIVQVTIVSPVETPIQLFYITRDRPAQSEEKSQTVMLKRGSNVIYFQLNQPGLIDPLRLDPGAASGQYVIESIVARSTSKSTAP